MNDPKHHNAPLIQSTAPPALFPAHHIAAQQLCATIAFYFEDHQAHIHEFKHPHSRRRIDLLGINTHSHHLTAYEIKANTADFLQELRNPDKTQPFLDLVHFFYFVSPPHVICPAMLPPRTGLIIVSPTPQGQTITTIYRAPKLNPPPPTWELLSAVTHRLLQDGPRPFSRPLPQQPLQAQIRQLARSKT